MAGKDYFIGLDCGTNSVGWAVTDEDYHLLRAKGKTLWGSRLFDEAETAADRRVHRSVRRRGHRAHARLKLLEELFAPEMVKVDPNFYLHLRKSALLSEDRPTKIQQQKYTLFNEMDFTDKDYYKTFPTIWHLRNAIIKGSAPKTKMCNGSHFDLRLYFLAIHHILKNRGHFLIEGSMRNGNADFSMLFDDFRNSAENFGFRLTDSVTEKVESIIKDKRKNKLDKKKELQELVFSEGGEAEDDLVGRQKELCGLLIGSKITPQKIFTSEPSEDAMKFSFDDGNFEDKEPEIEQDLGDSARLDLILAAKRIYDYGVLSNLLGKNESISAAMVANYDQHEQDLRDCKELLKNNSEAYAKIFKSDDPVSSYNAYVGKARTSDKNGRQKTVSRLAQPDFNKVIKNAFDDLSTDIQSTAKFQELYARAERGELFPKQRGQAKGTIPQQLHHNELRQILDRLEDDYPIFGKVERTEDDSCNTISKKIERIHDFRIPYYCGPLVKRKLDKDNRPVAGGKSEFSWADEEIKELIYPWNFKKLVDLNSRASNFIRRMTNQCTYLIGEDVLPKASFLYQKYMVLNELNNLKINGRRIEDVELKQKIFERGFVSGELTGNITLKVLKKYLIQESFIRQEDELTGTSEMKTLPKLSTHLSFRKVLGEDYQKRYSMKALEAAVNYITILGEERKMLAVKLQELLSCSEDEAKKLSKLSLKDWGNFSSAFLNGIRTSVNGVEMTILEALENTNCNLMELLGAEVGFQVAVDEFNEPKKSKNTRITYQDVQNLYCSPAVKRTVWQTLKIVDELVKVKKATPKKIFLEVTRGEDKDSPKGNYKLSRKSQLKELYHAINKRGEYNDLLEKLEGFEDRDLQSKKLYLYFTQLGRCAYSGKPINLEELNNSELYDIDHIYPRSKTKDDSITKNLVLVRAELNREKTNTYPISADIRSRMQGFWGMLRGHGLITVEKYNRLTRANPLTAEELGDFVARQIVETSQSIKAIRDLLQRAYPDTQVVMSKASQVSDFRHWFSKTQYDKYSQKLVHEAKPEFIKVRAINDLHHAKDAYLNIVVGNAIHETFTSDPFKWIRKQEDCQATWSLNPWVLWRDAPRNSLAMKGWNYAETIKIVSDTMKRNDILWTRMSYVESGAISDLQLVGKADSSAGILPTKKGMDPKKYGGYNSVKGAHFALIECKDKKGETVRRCVVIPQIFSANINKYVKRIFTESRVIISTIGYKSLMRLNGFPVHLSRKGNEGQLGFYHAIQAIFSADACGYIKRIEKAIEKDRELNGKYQLREQYDKITKADNEKLLDVFFDKLEAYRKMPLLASKIDEIIAHREDFCKLGEKEQVTVLHNFLNIFTCGPTTADLSRFVPKASVLGRCVANDNILKYDSALLIHQSPTGLFKKVVDLKTCKPEK
ncbi:MAG: type II CRISPR RNA-guided endonuclease Cas9 [Candidatus Saccharibacteria bacterium]|nr:type II CRISPR RNA-guided endonuclease Cas9 [Candidatus Saccharibacteria bacterium]